MNRAEPRSAATVLAQPLAERPNSEAVVSRSGGLTYAELEDLVSRWLGVLIDLNLRPGDRLAVSLTNDLPIVALFHAAMRLGAIWVGINRALAPPEKAYILRDSGASLFIGDAAMVEQARSADDLHELLRCLEVDPDPKSEWSELMSTANAANSGASLATPDPLAPAAIAYTSGTTGFPKGAVHSQHNLVVAADILVRTRNYGPTLRKADCFPLTILNMQVLSTLLVARSGGTAIVMDRVDPAGIAEWVSRERPTTWNGAPAMLYGLTVDEAVPATALETLDDVWSGGSPCPRATAAAFEAKFGCAVHSSYGLTEAPTVVTMPPRESHCDVACSGPPLPHLRVSILDGDDEEQPVGTIGEICIGPSDDGPDGRLYRPMLGYWNNPEATAKALRNGLLHTGDVGLLDERGYLTVQDRGKSLILRGGANVYPAEVERVINEFPGVAGSCVLGVPDDRLGARVIAAVEPRPSLVDLDVEKLRAHCAVSLARYKVPERFYVLPLVRNAMGKVIPAKVLEALGPVTLD
jgi:long-chain acyl-CoA synthetase